jgi:hypothetical protein
VQVQPWAHEHTQNRFPPSAQKAEQPTKQEKPGEQCERETSTSFLQFLNTAPSAFVVQKDLIDRLGKRAPHFSCSWRGGVRQFTATERRTPIPRDQTPRRGRKGRGKQRSQRGRCSFAVYIPSHRQRESAPSQPFPTFLLPLACKESLSAPLAFRVLLTLLLWRACLLLVPLLVSSAFE